MKKILLGFFALILLLPLISFAQTSPQAPASWIAFQQEQNAKKAAFYKQLKADRETFLNEHPDVRAYIQEMKASNNAKREAWKASHRK